MFFRIKKSGHRAYVQVVENKRFDGAVRQSVIANLGRADDLIASGALASLLASGAKFTDQVLLITTLDEEQRRIVIGRRCQCRIKCAQMCRSKNPQLGGFFGDQPAGW